MQTLEKMLYIYKTIKKLFGVVIIVLVIISFSACDSQHRKLLQSTIDMQVQPKDVYTTSSYNNYIVALENARQVNEKIFTSNDTLVETQRNLKNAIDNLEIATKGVYQINYEFVLESNDSVGNDWQKYVLYNDLYIGDGDYITATLDSTVMFNGIVVEHDSIPDVGTAKLEMNLVDGTTSMTQIIVEENKGRYSGNFAVWTLYGTIKLTELTN